MEGGRVVTGPALDLGGKRVLAGRRSSGMAGWLAGWLACCSARPLERTAFCGGSTSLTAAAGSGVVRSMLVYLFLGGLAGLVGTSSSWSMSSSTASGCGENAGASVGLKYLGGLL